MTDIVKDFPGVRALKGVQLKVRPGTVHTLMGENGAGKSTLMKCLIGIHPPTSGKIVFDGKEIRFKTTLEALNSGISMIHQELSPVPERSVSENLWLGRAPRKGLIIDHKKMRQDSIDLFQRLHLDVDPDEKMGNLTVAKMQMVEIAKAVSYDSKIVIMDEPTSSLTETEVEHLFRIIEDLKKKTVAIIYISHKMDEIFRISDDITVYRDGEYIASDRAENLNVDKLIQLMVGREVSNMFPKVDCPIGDTILKVENLSAGHAVKNVSFELHRGEILGMAGLVGAGGNQQKVLVGRWLLTDPDILIVDEPTRGIDVGAKAEIHSLITKLAGEGKAIIMISSELPEVMGMSDRIVVMHEGTMTAIVDRKDFSSELILKYATSEVPYQPAADEK